MFEITVVFLGPQSHMLLFALCAKWGQHCCVPSRYAPCLWFWCTLLGHMWYDVVVEAPCFKASKKNQGHSGKINRAGLISCYLIQSPAVIRTPTSPRLLKPCVNLAPNKKVYIQLPFKVDVVSNRINVRLKCVVERAFPAADLRWLARTARLPLPPVIDSLPTLTTSHCVYKDECAFASTYVRR